MVLFEGLTFKEEDQKNSGGVWGGGFKSSRLTDTPGDPQICPSSLRSAQRTITSPAQTTQALNTAWRSEHHCGLDFKCQVNPRQLDISGVKTQKSLYQWK